MRCRVENSRIAPIQSAPIQSAPIQSAPIQSAFLVIIAVAGIASGCDAQSRVEQSRVETRTAPHLSDSASGGVPADLVSGPWLAWRGPNRNGIVIDQNPPLTWSATENVIWKTEVPGRGHASPIIVNDQIILATSDVQAETQSVVSYDKTTGNQNWVTVVNTGNFNPRIFPANTHASSTVASDGQRLFAVFNNNEGAQLAALSLQGEVLWEKQAARFIPKQYQFGFGASPIVYKNTVIVTSECEQDGSMAAFDTESGEEIWRVARARATSYSTPVVAWVAGKEQLILSGGNAVTSWNPASGEENWSTPAPWRVTCGTAVWSNDLVFVSGGYPVNRTLAVRADGSGEVVWEARAQCYEQSMLYFEGYVYALADGGVCYCWRAADGQEMWKQRMEDKVSASPVLAGGHIYISVESGRTFVFRPSPERLEIVAENQLGDTAYATPAFEDDRIYLRVAEGPGRQKQEWLYCVGKQ
jgi:outer membrane protein assembly factor BamB